MRHILLPRIPGVLIVLTAGMLACGSEPLGVGSQPDDEAPSFISVPRSAVGPDGDTAVIRSKLVFAPASDVDPSQSFYLAINRRELDQRWFLSAYLKQFSPDAVLGGAARSLGTRVVSFRVQNGGLFVFDVDDRKQTSDTFQQDQVIDAYPIVDGSGLPARFRRDDYVVIDPAAGLNRFGVVGDAFGSGQIGLNRFIVELAFSQRFRLLADGVAFEQAFTGYADQPIRRIDFIDPNLFRASGVLGLAVRRYQEGEGYIPTPLPPQTHYFTSPPSLVPNAGLVERVAAKWNIHPGMTPIRWLISPEVLVAQARPEVQAAGLDLLGALKAGIESWNTAFGFPVVAADLATADDSPADDDKNYFIYDINPSIGSAFANWRSNPNTGEIRGASVYFNHGFVDSGLRSFPAAAPTAPATAIALPTALPPIPALIWEPFPRELVCDLRPIDEALTTDDALTLGPGLPPTRKERVEKYLAQVAAHEVGHTLGLRHNFKGSLVPPSSSIMDYISASMAAAGSIPGPYDVDAVRFLYGLSPALPAQPFCTDGDVPFDPTCERFDATADPLRLYFNPRYTLFANLFLTTGDPTIFRTADAYLNKLVSFAKNGLSPADRLDGFSFAARPVQVPVGADKIAANPNTYPAGVNSIAQRLFVTLVSNPAAPTVPLVQIFAPAPTTPLSDPAVLQQLTTALQGNLENADFIRSFETRRLSVDTLKRLQSLPAYAALRASDASLRDGGSGLPPDERALLDDLLARITRALSPYFDN
jgi:hypothetical protein